MKRLITWFKKLRIIVSRYEKDLNEWQRQINGLKNQVSELEKIISDRTTIGIDIGFKTANHIIVVGRYGGNDYVQTYSVNQPDFVSFIKWLNENCKHGTVDRIDSPPQFRAVFKDTIRHLREY